MSESDPKAPEAADSANPAAPETGSPPAAAAVQAPAPSRWLNLAIAVAVVTVGGFVLGRATSGNTAAPAAPAEPIALNVPPRGGKRVLPAALMRRLRMPRRTLPTAPTSPESLHNGEPAAVMAARRPGLMPPELPSVAAAMAAVQPKVQDCVKDLPASTTHGVVVRYQLHAEGTAGATVKQARLVYPAAGPEVHRCVVQAVQDVHVPTLQHDAVGAHTFAGR